MKALCGGPWPCVCDRCTVLTAEQHAAADKACGRVWSKREGLDAGCGCSTCERARKIALAEVEKRLGNLAALQRRYAALKAIRSLG